MLIRAATEKEFEAIKKQRLSSYKPYSGIISPEHWEFLRGTLSTKSDQKPGVKIFVAEIDGEIAGSVVLFPSAVNAYDWHPEITEYPEIRMLAVDPKHRNQGIGKALVNQCIKTSKDSNYQFIGIHTGSFMEEAIKLYEGMGFERVPTRDFTPLNDGITVKAFKLNI